MSKVIKCIWLSVFVICLFLAGTVFADLQEIQDNVIRIHVIANSDTAGDQTAKLSVRDAVIKYLQENMHPINNVQEAEQYIQNKLPEIQNVANGALQNAGKEHMARVSLTKETFQKRQYDTFSLPSGIYNSLRIEIGNAQGKNWWCVVFPSFCLPETAEGFRETAVAAGFDQGLVSSLSGETGYQLRFFFLDCFGKVENFFAFF